MWFCSFLVNIQYRRLYQSMCSQYLKLLSAQVSGQQPQLGPSAGWDPGAAWQGGGSFRALLGAGEAETPQKVKSLAKS